MPLEGTGAVVTFKGGVSCPLPGKQLCIYAAVVEGGAPGSHTIWDRVSVIRLHVLLIGYITDGFWEEC